MSSLNSRSPATLDVLYQDGALAVINKPAGLATMGVADDTPCVLKQLQCELEAAGRPNSVSILNRLDAPVSGTILVAFRGELASQLAPPKHQYKSTDAAAPRKRIAQTYWALLPKSPQPQSGTWENFIALDGRHRRVHIVDGDHQGKWAHLRYETLAIHGKATLVEIRLTTGRKHQIRAQAAARQMPVLGDRKYGSRVEFAAGIGLHARSCQFVHPLTGESVFVEAPLPVSWSAFVTPRTSNSCDS